jgi:hypothetical protein
MYSYCDPPGKEQGYIDDIAKIIGLKEPLSMTRSGDLRFMIADFRLGGA